MADIKHQLTIKATPERVYHALTTEEGLSDWWAKNTQAKPEVGFVNVFTFGKFRNEMKVTKLIINKNVEWVCINSIEEWVGTKISFALEEKDGNTILRFTQGGWRAVTDTFAICSYDWARFMTSLKLLCETGAGTPS